MLTTTSIGIDMNLPQVFEERMQLLLGDEFEAFLHALKQGEQPVSVRLNKAKQARIEGDVRSVGWSQGLGYYLPLRPTFTFDPLFHAGAYYVQEASSMFLAEVIAQYIDTPVRYLDMCAAPGGKSTLAHSVLPYGSLVVSNEVVRQRAFILSENIAKWGSPYSIVTNNTAEEWGRWKHYFDVIAADVPCSGEGMFRKDEVAINEWSPQAVALCADRQKEILDAVWSALRPGGLFIYSTCTYNIEENESMVDYMVKRYDAQPLPVQVDNSWAVSGALTGEYPVYRFLPHKTCGEGLFMALLRKPGECDDKNILLQQSCDKRKKQASKKKILPIPKEVYGWIKNRENYDFVADEISVEAYPCEYSIDMQTIRKSMNVLLAGISIATLKGKDLVPTQELLLSTAFGIDSFPMCEVELATALAYLRREAIVLPNHIERGYVALTYKNFPIGWVKNLGTRANNMYPQEWRIRSSHVPQIVEAGISR